jgi:hypothetical protein
VLAATGTRNCYYENYLTGAESCSKKLVVLAYDETYQAAPVEPFQLYIPLRLIVRAAGIKSNTPDSLFASVAAQSAEKLTIFITEKCVSFSWQLTLLSSGICAGGSLYFYLPYNGWCWRNYR